jgi:hypothetical protein
MTPTDRNAIEVGRDGRDFIESLGDFYRSDSFNFEFNGGGFALQDIIVGIRVKASGFVITAFARKPEPDDYCYDDETGEEHFLDGEEPEYEHVDVPSWPGQFLVSVCVLYTFWEELTGDGILMEE